MKDARLDPSNPAYYKSTIVGLLKAAKKNGLQVTLVDGPSGAKINFENEKGYAGVNLFCQREAES